MNFILGRLIHTFAFKHLRKVHLAIITVQFPGLRVKKYAVIFVGRPLFIDVMSLAMAATVIGLGLSQLLVNCVVVLASLKSTLQAQNYADSVLRVQSQLAQQFVTLLLNSINDTGKLADVMNIISVLIVCFFACNLWYTLPFLLLQLLFADGANQLNPRKLKPIANLAQLQL
jgi:hypothetical protein